MPTTHATQYSHVFLSCHYTNPIHCLTQSFAVSLYTIRSFFELQQRTPEEMVHCLVCFFALARAIIILYFQFFILSFLRPIFVRSLLRHFHSNQVPDAPLARDSLCVCIILWGTYCRWLDHISILLFVSVMHKATS